MKSAVIAASSSIVRKKFIALPAPCGARPRGPMIAPASRGGNICHSEPERKRGAPRRRRRPRAGRGRGPPRRRRAARPAARDRRPRRAGAGALRRLGAARHRRRLLTRRPPGTVKQVICISWGTKYGAPYVNRLYAMRGAQPDAAVQLHLLHRRRRGLPPGGPRRAAAAARRRDADRHQGHLAEGAALGRRGSATSTGPVLFMDLDLVVVGLARRLLQLRRRPTR